MSLTIRMRIDENDEHKYYYTTGDGTEIELIPLVVDANGVYTPDENKAYSKVTVNVPETELEELVVTTNDVYTAPSGKAYNVVRVNVQPILEAVSRTYRANGTYTIAPSSGKDGLSGVTVNVDVPTQPTPSIQASKSQTITQNGTVTVSPDSGYDAMEEAEITVNVPTAGNVQAYKSVSYTQNGSFEVTPDSGYDGIARVGVGINVPTGGGGGGDVLTGTVTMTDGESALPITIPSGKTIKEAIMFLTDYSDLANITLRRAMAFNGFVVCGDGCYKVYGFKNNAADTSITQKDITHEATTTPALNTFHALGVDSTTGEIKYRGKSVDTGYSFVAGYSYTYLVVLE